MATKKVISAGTGRRKTACARVTLAQGDGKWTVNNVALEDYITSEALRDYLKQPIAIAGFDASKVDVIVFAKGGGCSGQAGAIRHGLARALVEADANLRAALKKGFGYQSIIPQCRRHRNIRRSIKMIGYKFA